MNYSKQIIWAKQESLQHFEMRGKNGTANNHS